MAELASSFLLTCFTTNELGKHRGLLSPSRLWETANRRSLLVRAKDLSAHEHLFPHLLAVQRDGVEVAVKARGGVVNPPPPLPRDGKGASGSPFFPVLLGRAASKVAALPLPSQPHVADERLFLFLSGVGWPKGPLPFLLGDHGPTALTCFFFGAFSADRVLRERAASSFFFLLCVPG